MNAARRSYFVLIALLCYAILFSQTAHAAKLPRKPSAAQLPPQIKLVASQPVPTRETVSAAALPASISGWLAVFLFTGFLIGFALCGFPALQLGLARRALRRNAGWLDLSPQFCRFDLRV